MKVLLSSSSMKDMLRDVCVDRQIQDVFLGMTKLMRIRVLPNLMKDRYRKDAQTFQQVDEIIDDPSR